MEEIIKKLKLALQDAGTAEELKKFGIEPDQVEAVKDLKMPATLDEALKIKEVQSDFDKKIAKALATREENLKSEFDFVKKEQKKDEKDDVDVKDPAMKALMAKLEEMSTEITTLKQEKAQETQAQKRARAIENLKAKGIPAVYVHELDLDKDFDEQLETVSNKFKEDGGSFQPEPPKPGQGRLPQPRNPGSKNEPSKAEVEAFKKLI